MNKELQLQHDTLVHSFTNLNAILKNFMIKVAVFAEKIADQFSSKKLNWQRLRELEETENIELLAYKDSIMQRFVSSFTLTTTFLKSYLEQTLSITTTSNEQIFQSCFENKIINQSELEQLLKLEQDFNKIAKQQEPEISEEIIYYCLLMNNIVNKFKN